MAKDYGKYQYIGCAFVIILSVVTIYSCSSSNGTYRVLYVDKKGQEIIIDKNYSQPDSVMSKNWEFPFSPIPWLSFALSESDSIKILLYSLERIELISFVDYLSTGYHYINLEKLSVPSGYYLLKYESSRDTVVKAVLVNTK